MDAQQSKKGFLAHCEQDSQRLNTRPTVYKTIIDNMGSWSNFCTKYQNCQVICLQITQEVVQSTTDDHDVVGENSIPKQY